MAKAPPKMTKASAPQPKRESWATTKGKRLTGRHNQKARDALFAREPLCRECFKHGRIQAAAIRDHIVALAFGGTESPGNEQPLCIECHDVKSKTEAAEGARRQRPAR